MSHAAVLKSAPPIESSPNGFMTSSSAVQRCTRLLACSEDIEHTQRAMDTQGAIRRLTSVRHFEKYRTSPGAVVALHLGESGVCAVHRTRGTKLF
eukprot:272227-Pleurochrysis_carterae.AAC.1